PSVSHTIMVRGRPGSPSASRSGLSLRHLLRNLYRRRALLPEARVERRQLDGERLSPAAHGPRHMLTRRGKHGSRLLARLALRAPPPRLPPPPLPPPRAA